MRPFRRLAVLALVSLPACKDATPSGPNGFLTGKWDTFNPAGWFELSLQAAGGLVIGTAVDHCCGSGDVETRGTVTGTYGGGGFTLHLSFPMPANWAWMGTEATWTGQLTTFVNTDALEGPLVVTSPIDSSLGTFFVVREPSP